MDPSLGDQPGEPTAARSFRLKWLLVFVSAALVLSVAGVAIARAHTEARAESAVQATLSTLDTARSIREDLQTREESSKQLLGATVGQVDDDDLRQTLSAALDDVRSLLAREVAAPDDSVSLAEALAAQEQAQEYLTELLAAGDAMASASEAVSSAHATWVLRQAVSQHAAAKQELADAIASAERLMSESDGRVTDESVRESLQNQIDAASTALGASVDDSDLASVTAQTQVFAEALRRLQGASSTTEDSEAAWAAAQAAAEAARAPIGGLRVLGPGDGWDYGQGFASGNCANWKIGLVNQSDTPVTRITFAPPGGSYTKWGDIFDEIPATTPSPAVVEIYLAPGTTQDVEFQTCTSTPVPSEDYEFGAVAPDSVRFTWSTGQEGTASFGW